jgi:GH35 family endo-1,4-beta-xylanase
VLAEISTELNWHSSLIKLFVTEKVVWRLKCCRLKHVLVTLKYHYKHQIFCKWEVVAEVVVVVVFVNRKYLKGPSSNIGTLQTSFSIHRVLFPNAIILAKTALQKNLLFLSCTKIE